MWVFNFTTFSRSCVHKRCVGAPAARHSDLLILLPLRSTPAHDVYDLGPCLLGIPMTTELVFIEYYHIL